MVRLHPKTLLFFAAMLLLTSHVGAAIDSTVTEVSPASGDALTSEAPVIALRGYSLEAFDYQQRIQLSDAQTGERLPYTVLSQSCHDECRGSFWVCECGEPGRSCSGEPSTGAIQTVCRARIRTDTLPTTGADVRLRLLDADVTVPVSTSATSD